MVVSRWGAARKGRHFGGGFSNTMETSAALSPRAAQASDRVLHGQAARYGSRKKVITNPDAGGAGRPLRGGNRPSSTDTKHAAECYANNPPKAALLVPRRRLQLQPANVQPWKLNLHLRGYGRDGGGSRGGQRHARQNRVELTRANGAIVEWYENKAVGWNRASPCNALPRRNGPLRVILEAQGTFAGTGGGKPSRAIRQRNGQTVLRYHGLKVWMPRTANWRRSST